MPNFLPFRGVRYQRSDPDNSTADISDVAAPPYDVIEPDERAALLARDAHNAVRLILPDSYAGAADALRTWLADGTLAVDDAPTFSVYRMHFTGDDGQPQVTTGVLGALSLEPGGVLPHERTLPKAKSDRLDLLRATRANLDPIWGLTDAAELSDLLATHGAPDATAVDGDGVRHECFIVHDPVRIDAISARIGDARMVLADGHHRYETAGTSRRERTEAGTATPDDDLIMAFVVELAPEQLCVRAIHRLVHDLGDVDVRAAVAPWFTVDELGPNDPAGVAALERAMRDQGGLGWVDADGLALLRPLPALADARRDEPPALHDVDSARFDAGIRPALGRATLTYRNHGATCAAQVRAGQADAAVLLRPVSVETIRVAAAAGVRMPEKTTFFAPKPRTGMVFRSLDG